MYRRHEIGAPGKQVACDGKSRSKERAPGIRNTLAFKMIAVIDDDESIRVAVEQLIDSYGFSVKSFRSAESFLSSVNPGSIDCLITDIQMPGMSGMALHQVLRNRKIEIPVIFMTAFFDEALRQTALSNHAIAFLVKPFRSHELIAKIEIALARPPGPRTHK